MKNMLIVICLLVVPTHVFSAEQCAPFSPSVDGCSDYYFDTFNFKTDFTGACNQHDYCYRTIGKTRGKCDKEFESDVVASCNKKYLRYERYQKVSEKCIAGILLGLPVACLFTEDVYDWVETTIENAQRVVQLLYYPECIVTAGLYYAAVDRFGGPPYRDAQGVVTNWARGLAKGYIQGSCAVPSKSSNLFELNTNNVINKLYDNMLNREPTGAELTEAISVSNQDVNWEYHVINKIDGRVTQRNAAITVIINVLLQ